MMGYKVIESFIDLQTDEGYNEGSTFASDDVERVAFLIESGYLKGEFPKPQIDETILSQAKELKIKGYTKMTEEELIAAIDAELAKEASD